MPVVGKFVPIWLSEPPLMAAINWPPATARPWTLLLFSWEMPVPSAATCQTPLLAVAVPLPLAQTAPQSLLAAPRMVSLLKAVVPSGRRLFTSESNPTTATARGAAAAVTPLGSVPPVATA